MWCAVNIETHKRYVSNKATYHKIQEVSDRLCAEYSLSVVTEKSGRRGKSYAEYQADKYGTSWKSLLRRTLDAAIRSSDNFDAFLAFMQEAGYEVKHGKYISFRAVGQERFTRAKTAGDEKVLDSPAYRHWASKHNLHAMVDAFNYLTENYNTDLSELERRYAATLPRLRHKSTRWRVGSCRRLRSSSPTSRLGASLPNGRSGKARTSSR